MPVVKKRIQKGWGVRGTHLDRRAGKTLQTGEREVCERAPGGRTGTGEGRRQEQLWVLKTQESVWLTLVRRVREADSRSYQCQFCRSAAV